MKRAAITVLAVSLMVVPAFARKTVPHKSSVSKAHCVTLEHIYSGWRMEIACDQGGGAIVRLDSQQYRGDGVFAGWSQKRMRTLFQSLIPQSSDKASLGSSQLD